MAAFACQAHSIGRIEIGVIHRGMNQWPETWSTSGMPSGFSSVAEALNREATIPSLGNFGEEE